MDQSDLAWMWQNSSGLLVRVAGSRHRLDRLRQKDDVSNPEQGRQRPETNGTATARGEEGSRDKDAVTHGWRYAKYVLGCGRTVVVYS